MRKRTLILLTALVFLTGNLIAQSAFEGSYLMEVTDGSKKDELNQIRFTVKGNKTLMEPVDSKNGQQAKLIADRSTQEMIMLMDNGGYKMGIKISMNNAITQPASKDTLNKSGKQAVIKETSETRVIDGYTCKKVIIEEPDGETVVAWITKELGLSMADMLGFMSAGTPGSQPKQGPIKNYEVFKDAVSMETIITDKDGKVTTVRLKEIKKSVVPEVVFSTAGYQIVDMKNMGTPER